MIKKKIDYLDKLKTWAFYLFGISFVIHTLNLFLNNFLSIGNETRVISGTEFQFPMFNEAGYMILDTTRNTSNICFVIAIVLFFTYIIVKPILYFKSKINGSKPKKQLNL